MEFLVIDIFVGDVSIVVEGDFFLEDISNMVDDVIGDMISIGIFGDFFFGGVDIVVKVVNGRVDDFDWSKLVLFKFGGDLVVDFVWS